MVVDSTIDHIESAEVLVDCHNAMRPILTMHGAQVAPSYLLESACHVNSL